MLCGDSNGKEIQKRRDICIHTMADSLHCTVETNTTLWRNYTPIKINLKKESGWDYYYLNLPTPTPGLCSGTENCTFCFKVASQRELFSTLICTVPISPKHHGMWKWPLLQPDSGKKNVLTHKRWKFTKFLERLRSVSHSVVSNSLQPYELYNSLGFSIHGIRQAEY